jgi:putative ABC transport system permease protein
MRIREQIDSGILGLLDHPFRSFLTTLGIIFGTAAVIAMVSIGAGAEREAIEELKRFGINSIRVNRRILDGEELRDANKKLARGLSLEDCAYLRESFPFLESVVPEKIVEERPYFFGQKPSANIVGVGSGFIEASRLEIASGRFIDEEDHRVCGAVVVLGNGVAHDLFGDSVPLGAAIQIGRVRFRIIGVMKGAAQGKGKLAIKSRDHDRDIYIPISASLERVFKREEEDRDTYHRVTGIWLTVQDGYDLLKARDTTARALKRRHRGIEDFETMVPLEILQQSQKTQRLFNLVMALIAAISLVVGGIGIMNIMLAGVNERTREIGVRRAIGASQRDIAVQFLTEAVIISLSGGVMGILLGVGLSYGIAAWTGWTTVIPLHSVLLAFGVSAFVGVIFGFFPAVKAARLDPVTALRYE